MKTYGCKDCTERKHKCHSDCEYYKEYSEKNEIAKKERHQEEIVKIYQVDMKNKNLKERRNHKLWKRKVKR